MDVTRLLLRWGEGDRKALDDLLPLVYAELRKVARRVLRNERPDHTLTPTALIHEAYLRMVDTPAAGSRGRAQFFAVSAQVMRHILVDHARARRAKKRDGARQRVTLGAAAGLAPGSSVDLVALDDALQQLAALDERQARLVELRFFGGLTLEETAATLGISTGTVKREWRVAKAFLFDAIGRA